MKSNAYLTEVAPLVEQQLAKLLATADPRQETLYAAMRHSVLAGGKRLRPALFLATLDAFGQDSRAYLPFAAALEMIHTYSLIHDDLPAMDNDDFRRGKPTCHKVYGEAMAVLAGDGLLTHAFAVMAGQTADPQRLLAAIALVAKEAGLSGMVAGQATDISVAGQEIDEELLRYIYRGKTSALFAAAIGSAACLAGADQRQQDLLRQYSLLLGYVFQIVDDVLDIQGDAALLGKPIGSDAKNAKTTYASLLGCDQAMAYARQLAEQAQELLKDFGPAAEVLRGVPEYFTTRTL